MTMALPDRPGLICLPGDGPFLQLTGIRAQPHSPAFGLIFFGQGIISITGSLAIGFTSGTGGPFQVQGRSGISDNRTLHAQADPKERDPVFSYKRMALSLPSIPCSLNPGATSAHRQSPSIVRPLLRILIQHLGGMGMTRTWHSFSAPGMNEGP